MIYKNRNSQGSRSKFLIVLPLICIVVSMTAAKGRALEPADNQVSAIHVDSLPASTQKATFVNYNFGTRSLQAETQLDSLPKIGKTLTVRSNNGPGSKALIIVDGVKQEQRGAMGYGHIQPDQIESINVLKDQSAINAYGADGAEGVILIKTKK